MSKTKICFAKCSYAARRQLQHLQRRFARGRETRSTSEKYRTPEICGSNLCQDVEARSDQFLCYLAQSLAQLSIFNWPFQHSDEARSQQEVGETARHDQAFVMCLGGKRGDMYFPVGAPRSSQSSLLVAGHHDVPKLRLRVQQQLYGPAALGAVSGSRQ